MMPPQTFQNPGNPQHSYSMITRQRESGGFRRFDEDYEVLDIIEVHALSARGG